jgi:hypothetical protein
VGFLQLRVELFFHWFLRFFAFDELVQSREFGGDMLIQMPHPLVNASNPLAFAEMSRGAEQLRLLQSRRALPADHLRREAVPVIPSEVNLTKTFHSSQLSGLTVHGH